MLTGRTRRPVRRIRMRRLTPESDRDTRSCESRDAQRDERDRGREPLPIDLPHVPPSSRHSHGLGSRRERDYPQLAGCPGLAGSLPGLSLLPPEIRSASLGPAIPTRSIHPST